jgi:hypothetical protein
VSEGNSVFPDGYPFITGYHIGNFSNFHFLKPTSRFRGPDTLWRVPWNRLLGRLFSY